MASPLGGDKVFFLTWQIRGCTLANKEQMQSSLQTSGASTAEFPAPQQKHIGHTNLDPCGGLISGSTDRKPLSRLHSLWTHHSIGDQDRGGQISENLRGVKILKFRGSLNLTLFYRNSGEILNLRVKSPSFPRTTFGASSPPPPVFGTFCPPRPPPVSRSLTRQTLRYRKMMLGGGVVGIAAQAALSRVIAI